MRIFLTICVALGMLPTADAQLIRRNTVVNVNTAPQAVVVQPQRVVVNEPGGLFGLRQQQTVVNVGQQVSLLNQLNTYSAPAPIVLQPVVAAYTYAPPAQFLAMTSTCNGGGCANQNVQYQSVQYQTVPQQLVQAVPIAAPPAAPPPAPVFNPPQRVLIPQPQTVVQQQVVLTPLPVHQQPCGQQMSRLRLVRQPVCQQQQQPVRVRQRVVVRHGRRGLFHRR